MKNRIPLFVPLFLAGSIALSACGVAAPYAPTPIAIAPLPGIGDNSRPATAPVSYTHLTLPTSDLV